MSDHERGSVGRRTAAESTGGAHHGRGAVQAMPGKRTLVESLVQQSPSASHGGGNPAEGAPSVHAAAERGISGSSGPLPFADAIQRSFGPHDIGDIQAHTDGAAAEGTRAMGAAAFATGNHVAFASTPDLHTAAHEAAHVVQQRAGVHLKGGVGEVGDPYERNADEVADRVVQGRSAEDLLPAAPGTAAVGTSVVERKLQLRPAKDASKDVPKEMTDAQIKAALAWATTSKVGAETIKEIQGVCGLDKSGVYDEATAKAVFAKQRELGLGADGIAGKSFCQRTGLIFTNEITAATVADKDLETVKTKFPNGVTVAIYPHYKATVKGHDEFKRKADQFAATQGAVGVSNGAVAIGTACPIEEVGDVIEVVQSIHRGLLKKWTDSQQGSTADGAATKPTEPPAYTKVLNLALFAHGESWGMGLNASSDFSHDGLHNDKRGMNPSNIEAFVRGLSSAVVPGVRVELFACNTGQDKARIGSEWTGHKQGDKAGGGSFASSMAQALGAEATVSAHTTAGHTTENFAARVFGAEAGGGADGISLFDSMYPESYVQSELVRLFPTLDDAARAARHDSLREQMWAHYKDSINGEYERERDHQKKRYSGWMGQEAFTNPDKARALLDADWRTNWIPKHLDQVKPLPEKKGTKGKKK